MTILAQTKWPKGRFSFWLFLLLSVGGLSGRMLPFHHYRHCTHVRFTAVLGMNVLQHCLSRQRSRIPRASIEVLNSLGVGAGTTDESRTAGISTDAIHSSYSVHDLLGNYRDWSNLKFIDAPLESLYQCPCAPPSNEA